MFRVKRPSTLVAAFDISPTIGRRRKILNWSTVRLHQVGLLDDRSSGKDSDHPLLLKNTNFDAVDG